MENKITKKITGEVVSNKMNKTIIIKVTRKYSHKKYGKIITKSRKFKVHSDKPIEIGKKIIAESCSPISKEKSFKFVKVL